MGIDEKPSAKIMHAISCDGEQRADAIRTGLRLPDFGAAGPELPAPDGASVAGRSALNVFLRDADEAVR